MITPLRFIFFNLTALPCLLAFILFYASENTAITQSNWTLTKADIQRAKTIVSNSASKKRKTIKLNQKDLNIALSYLLNYYKQNASHITIKDNLSIFKIALFTDNYFGKYLNFSFKLTKQHGYPVINSLQIGQIKIADEFAGLILENLIKYSPLNEYYILAAQHVRNIDISTDGVTIAYIPFPDSEEKLGFNNKSLQSVIFYQQQITNIIAQHDPKKRIALDKLLQPLFKIAYQRSTLDNAIEENRSLLIAMSSYVNKKQIQAYLPFDINPNAYQPRSIFLYKRKDMVQHFMISASLAAAGAESLAYMLGQEKELNDAKKGSGFSFIDLASDRAGLEFGKTAVLSNKQARALQKNMLKVKNYSAFMPDVRDLPENMSNQDFKNKFESVYSAKYQNMLKIIDTRIAKLAIYKKD